ncbi:hypothetical protein BHM03_00002468 [Ensete ventricosum]|uniref:Protein kinase domain-containing protein n=1 Tax=Ensete ventricosum TaxID=4639 RepID=A0A445M9N9_ENSVE|nr:hypothetical protein BHM03_00002468 [Ensete ventricosum]
MRQVLYRSNNDGKQYAIKLIACCSNTLDITLKSNFIRHFLIFLQVSIMKIIEHPNIINLIEVIDDPESDNLYMGANIKRKSIMYHNRDDMSGSQGQHKDGNDVLCRSPGTPVFTAPECCLGYYSSRPQFLY